MDSNRIKRLAQGVREELRREVAARLDAVVAPGSAERLADGLAVEALEARIASEGREAVVDSAAYTWFNRLCALRFMDAVGYAPSPVVTPRAGATLPAMLADAQRGSFDPEYGIPPEVRARVTELLAGGSGAANATEAAYAELLRAVCGHYARTMPFMFSEEVAPALLMPANLLAEGSILRRIAGEMDDEACKSVEVLGWLYQHYIAERKDEVFAGFKKGLKAGPSEIGPATQLFTPEWIVRYLCENSLGRLWMLNNPDSALAGEWEYYIAPQCHPERSAAGAESKDLPAPEPHITVPSASDIRVLDPACGSGHILVYAFDLLFGMYEEEGWFPEDIPAMILENNLRGLEIDPRAAEIARFALMCKALERDPRFLERPVIPDVRVLEAAALDDSERALLSDGLLERTALLDAMAHMTEVGSLYVPAAGDAGAIHDEIARLAPRAESGDMIARGVLDKLGRMLANVEALTGTYHCVIANPPYMGSSNMNKWLAGWLKSNYPDEKSDLFAAFIARNCVFAMEGGELGFMSPYVWMFISSHEKLRRMIVDEKTITSLIQLEYSGFAEATVPICTFTVSNQHIPDYKGGYVRLSDFVGANMQAPKALEAIKNPDCGWFYRRSADSFKSIPGTPIAYWASDSLLRDFEIGVPLSTIGLPRQGLATGENARFVRNWWEVAHSNSKYDSATIEESVESKARWFPYNKGGDFRKWYGNNDWVINWENDGEEIRKFNGSVIRNQNFYFSSSITWSKVSSGSIAFRYKPPGHVFDVAGTSIFTDDSHMKYLQGVCNSSVMCSIAGMLSPTLNFEVGQIATYPIIENRGYGETINSTVDHLRASSQSDWDSIETSWDFKRHPLI